MLKTILVIGMMLPLKTAIILEIETNLILILPIPFWKNTCIL